MWTRKSSINWKMFTAVFHSMIYYFLSKSLDSALVDLTISNPKTAKLNSINWRRNFFSSSFIDDLIENSWSLAEWA